MHRSQRITGAALAAVAALTLALPGCTEDGDTVTNVTNIVAPLPGNYPGADETKHYVASDGTALSEPSHQPTPLVNFATTTALASGLRWFPSGVNGAGIALYLTTSTGGQFTLWAHHYDGSTFTKAVALLGANQDTSVAPFLSEAQVLFLNTTGTNNGDAMIFWRSIDQDTTTATERLYYSYFDASLRTTGTSTTDPDVRWGFDSTGAAIDQGNAIADVTCLAVISDGTRGEGTFIGDFAAPIGSGPQTGNHFNITFFAQGDATTFAGITYVQPTTVGGPARLHYRMLNFTTGVLSGNSSIPMPASANGATDAVLDLLKTYNGSIFFTAVDVANGENETCWSAYGTTGAPSAFMNTTATLNASGTNHDSGSVNGLVGSDEGLVNLVGRFQTKNLGGATNIDLFAFQVDPATGAFTPANDRVEIDDDPAPANANQPVIDDSAQSTLNRTGELLIVAWRQERGNTNTSDNGTALFARGIQLTRSGTAPALTDRVTAGGAIQVDAITADGGSNDVVTQFKFQGNLQYQGFQSDRNTFHIIWQQDESTGGANDQARNRSFTFTPSTVGTTQPVQFAAGSEFTLVFKDGELAQNGTNVTPGSNVGPGGWGALWGTDAGGTGSGSFSGGLALCYVRDESSTSTPSYEASMRRQTGATSSTTTQVGSIGSGGTAHAILCLGGAFPNNLDTTTNPNWSGTGIHVIIAEQRAGNQPLGAGTVTLRHRFFDKSSSSAETARFTPQVTGGSPPSAIDSGVPGDMTLVGAGANGAGVGVWFTHAGHIWYQVWNPSSRTWLQSGGAPAPELVDHADSSAITGGTPAQIVLSTNPTSAGDELSRAMLFWRKGPTGNNRWFARPRD